MLSLYPGWLSNIDSYPFYLISDESSLKKELCEEESNWGLVPLIKIFGSRDSFSFLSDYGNLSF